jgi:hypothetical protein
MPTKSVSSVDLDKLPRGSAIHLVTPSGVFFLTLTGTTETFIGGTGLPPGLHHAAIEEPGYRTLRTTGCSSLAVEGRPPSSIWPTAITVDIPSPSPR